MCIRISCKHQHYWDLDSTSFYMKDALHLPNILVFRELAILSIQTGIGNEVGKLLLGSSAWPLTIKNTW